MISFFVPGHPRPGGSKKAFYIAKLGRSIITDAGKNNKEWRSTIAVFAQQARAAAGVTELLDGPLELCVAFYMPRPKGHYRANGELKPTAPVYHTSAPDTTKLIRALEDALNKVLWVDDSRIGMQSAYKFYTNPQNPQPGARITVCEIEKEIRPNEIGAACPSGTRVSQDSLPRL